MRQLRISVMAIVLGIAGVTAMTSCATAPKSQSDRDALVQQAETTLQTMRKRDVNLDSLLQSSAGFVVLPNVGKAGFIAGGAHGRGVLYENGRPTGFVQLSQASVGAQVGAQSFSELIVFQNRSAVERLKRGKFELGANASAVALTAGAARSTNFVNGIAVFVLPRGGAMAELSISGQRLQFVPAG